MSWRPSSRCFDGDDDDERVVKGVSEARDEIERLRSSAGGIRTWLTLGELGDEGRTTAPDGTRLVTGRVWVDNAGDTPAGEIRGLSKLYC